MDPRGPECRALEQCFSTLTNSLQQSPDDITAQLRPSGMLAQGDVTFLKNPQNDDYKKAEKIVNIVIIQAKNDPQVYRTFVAALKAAGPWTRAAVQSLEDCFSQGTAREDCQTKSSETPKEAIEIVSNPSISPLNQTPRCKEHNVEAKLYCTTCLDLLCYDCTSGINHKGHTFRAAKDIVSNCKEELGPPLKKLRNTLDETEQALSTFNARENKIRDQGATVKDKIQNEIEQLIQFLSKRKTELTDNLELLIRQKLQELSTQKSNVEKTQAEMSSCLEYAETGLKTGSEGDVLKMKTPVLKQIDEIMTEFDRDTLQPNTEADIELFTDEQVFKACEYFGEVSSNTIHAENSYATGDGRKFAIKDTQVSVEVHPMSRRKEKFEQEFELTAKLLHMKSGETIECAAKQENGRHVITYQPVSRGRHHLHIRINNRHIQGSPYSVAVAPSLASFAKPSSVMKNFVKPHRAVINSKSVTIAGDHNNHEIIGVWNKKTVLQFGGVGTADGQLRQPCGVAVDLDDNIYVADNDNNRIQKFTPDGKFLKKVGCLGSGNDEFHYPLGICFNKSDKNLYVCDQRNNRIKVITTTDLKFVRCFGGGGAGNGQLQLPKYAAFDDSNNLYVTDYANNRVQVFTAEGKFVSTFSKKGSEYLLEPYGIAIDSGNIVYVSELSKNCISMFTTEGDFIASFGSMGTEEGFFDRICGLLDDSNSLIVSEAGNSRLQVFTI